MAENPKAIGNVFNIGNSNGDVTTKELAEKIVKAAKSDSKIVFKEVDFPDVKNRVPDVSKANEILGYIPKVSVDEGIEKTVAWFKEHLDEV